MKAEKYIFLFVGVFLLVVAPIYWFMAHEPAGGVALLLAALMSFMIFGYIHATARKMPLRYEDNADGEVIDGAGELGFFPPSSIWPFFAALTVCVVLLGPVFGWWISILGVAMGIWSVSGWLYQYYVGDYAH